MRGAQRQIQRQQPGERHLGSSSNSRASPRAAFASPNRSGPRPIRQRAGRQLAELVADTGFDGWEEASWELDLKRCTDDRRRGVCQGACRQAKKHGLEIFTVAAHSARSGTRRRAYRQDAAIYRRRSGRGVHQVAGQAATAPRTNPYFVPDEVGEIIHQQAAKAVIVMPCDWPITWASCETARCRCRASSARRHIAGATFSVSAVAAKHRRPCHPRCSPGQPGFAGRAVRPGL